MANAFRMTPEEKHLTALVAELQTRAAAATDPAERAKLERGAEWYLGSQTLLGLAKRRAAEAVRS